LLGGKAKGLDHMSTKSQFEWDSRKSKSNHEKHGFDFEYATSVFDGFMAHFPSPHEYNGEKRVLSLGQIGQTVICIVHTQRGTKTRIISARIASQEERSRYHAERSRQLGEN
jgi:uncharacterized protein